MIEEIKKEQYRISNWSGGTTTEIFLAPKDGSYAKRCFSFRISSATVDLEESDFTPLEGVKRYLTILEGEMELTFRETGGDRQVMLKPYEVVDFMGDIPTHSVGKARDFNLMLKGCSGRMETFTGTEFTKEIKKGEEVFAFSVNSWVGSIESGEGTTEERLLQGEHTLHIYDIRENQILKGKGHNHGNWVVITVTQ